MTTELQKHIKEKIDELTFANYEGVVTGLIILVVDKGSFKIMPAYDNTSTAILNVALDLAKDALLATVKSNLNELKDNSNG